MSDTIPTEIAEELKHLENRVRRLAEEKSYLQLVLRMIEQVNPLPGVHEMVGNVLHNVIESIGGTDIKIWFWIESELHYANFLGAHEVLVAIDDPVAAEVAQNRRFIELRNNPDDALLKGGALSDAWTWCFPLLLADDLIGVVKLENVNIAGASLRSYLPIFFRHLALILSNEIRSLLRQRAEEALRLAASVFANSQEGIVITDAENRILDVNESFTSITGYSHDEVLGRNPKLLSSGVQDADFYAAMWAGIAARGTWRGEIWNRRKSGEIFAEMLSIDAVLDESGKIQHYVGAFSDISYIKRHLEELERIAHFDALTGLPNRRLLADRLSQELARTRRLERTLAICYVDLDGFKPVNDQYGHEAGDRVLIEIAKRLLDVVRAGDTVSRLGGDEFVLLFCGLAHEDEYLTAVARVLEAVAAPITINGIQVQVSASIGVTLFPHDDVEADTLLRHADQAMYLAKEAGKNCFQLYRHPPKGG